MPPFTSSDHCKLSLITLDTAGVVLDAWCDDRGTYWIYNIGHGVPSLHRVLFLFGIKLQESMISQ